jgi:hypothetical protein
MNVRNLFFWTALCMAIAPAKLALAGAAGHGGAAVVCASSAEMLDLYEGSNVYGLTFTQPTSGTPAAVANAVLNKLNNYPAFKALLKQEIAGVLENARVMDIGAQNIPTDDVFPIITHAGCSITTAAMYVNNEDIILVDNGIFNSFNVLNQAALYLHEAVFKIAREHGNALNSIAARKITAYLLSNGGDFTSINREITAFRAVPFPSFGQYWIMPPRSTGIDLQVSKNAETIVLKFQTDTAELNTCSGTYRYNQMSDPYTSYWVSVNPATANCVLHIDRPVLNSPSRIAVGVLRPDGDYYAYDIQYAGPTRPTP